MKQLVLILTLALNVNLCAQNSISKTDLNWLVGNWKMIQGTLTITEHWETKNSTELHGIGYVIKGADTVVRELMKIEKIGKHWIFIAQINNNNPVLFTLKPSSNAKELEFENLEHDAPQRVIYEYVSKTQLYARTEADKNGKELIDEYDYTKINE